VQIKDKEEKEVMRRGCRPAEKKRVPIMDEEDLMARSRGCRQAEKSSDYGSGGREGNEEGVQAEKSADYG
jgi:hypothetical protein